MNKKIIFCYLFLTIMLAGTNLLAQGSGRALEFDGVNEYVDCGNHSDFDIVDNITVEAWVNPSSIGIDRQIISKGYNGTITQYELKTTTTDGKVSFRTWNGSSGIGAESSSSLPADSWTHVAGVYNGSDWMIYINGILENTLTAGGPASTTNNLNIGAVDANGTPGQFWEGQLDEVRVWNVARTETEIRQNMCQKLAGNETGLQGYWRLDESSGTTVQDYSSNSHNGTMVNMEDPDDHVWSGAPIGDVSDYDYGGAREFAFLTLGGDTFTANVAAGALEPLGIHVYGVNSAPNFTNIEDPGPYGTSERLSDAPYFGVFTTGTMATRQLNFDVTYQYGAHPELDAECTYGLLRRDNNADSVWTNDDISLDMDNDEIHDNGLYNQAEFILGSTENLYACGVLDYNTYWEGIDTVFVYCDIVIPDNVTLDIEEGVYVEFQAGLPLRNTGPGIYCAGSILAEGTTADTITFTVNDPEFNDWGGIHLMSDSLFYSGFDRETGSSIFTHCLIEYVYNDEFYLFTRDRQSEYGAAISMYDYPDAEIAYCEIRYSSGMFGGGISAIGESYPYIHHNNIHDNFSLIGGGIAIEDFEDTEEIPLRDDVIINIHDNEIYNNFAIFSGGGIHLMDLAYFFNGWEGITRGVTEFNLENNNIYENMAFSYPLLELYMYDGNNRNDLSEPDLRKLFELAEVEVTDKQLDFYRKAIPVYASFFNSGTRDYPIFSQGGGGVFASYVNCNLTVNQIIGNVTLGWTAMDILEGSYLGVYEGYTPMGLSVGCGAGVHLRGLPSYSEESVRSEPPYEPLFDNNDISYNIIPIIVTDSFAVFYDFLGEVRNDNPRIWDDQFYSTGMGAGVYSIDCYPTFENSNNITGNEIFLTNLFLREQLAEEMQKSLAAEENGDRNSNSFPALGFGGGICQITTLIDTMGVDSTYFETFRTLTMSETLVDSNLALWGGGLALIGYNYSELTDCIIDNNSTWTIPGFPMGDSLAIGIGGGIYNEGMLIIDGGSISGNLAGMGGGIAHDTYYPYFGNGITRQELVMLDVSDCDITYNDADWGAGGGVVITYLHHEVAWGVLEEYIWYNNRNSGDRAFGEVYFTDCNIDYNSANNRGGGINVSGNNEVFVSIEGGSLSHNIAGMTGGGINTWMPTHLSNVDIIGNALIDYYDRYTSNDGGGICSFGPLWIEGCRINENSSESDGGGICWSFESEGYFFPDRDFSPQALFTIVNTELRDNVCYDQGGGLYVDYEFYGEGPYRDLDVEIINCLIANNEAVFGGGCYFEYEDIYQFGYPRQIYGSMTNNTIVNNRAVEDEYGGGYGGGIYFEEAFMGITNNIIWGNRADYDGDQIFIEEGSIFRDDDRSVFYIEYCDIEGGSEEFGYGMGGYDRFFSIIDIDPAFADSANGDYTLLDYSPCINTGTPDTTGYNIPVLDLAGNPRVYDGWIDRIDLGCFEFQGDVVQDSDIFYLEDIVENDLNLCAVTVYVIGDVVIPDTVTVTICPGTTVMFVKPDVIEEGGFVRDAYTYAIDVYGTLIAEGTPEEMITFTAEDPGYGWGGIRFNGTDNENESIFEYCIFEYGNKLHRVRETRKEKEKTSLEDEDLLLEKERYLGQEDDLGGAIYAYDYYNFSINECIFRYNSAEWGGALYLEDLEENGVVRSDRDPDIVGPYITNTLFMDNYSSTGGGAIDIACEYNNPSFVDCTFLHNYNDGSYGGGAIHIGGYSTPYFETCIIDSNYSWYDGGAVKMGNYASPLFVDCTFNYNEADDMGGAVKASYYTSPEFDNCEFIGNLAGDQGGALELHYSSHTILENCRINYNTSYYEGGGVMISGGSSGSPEAYLNNCEIIGNNVYSDYRNYGDGGGLMIKHDAYAELLNCVIADNSAEDDGGGFKIAGATDLLVINCLISDNSAGEDGGGGKIAGSSSAEFINSTISGNSATDDGGGIFIGYNYGVDIINSIIWGNNAGYGDDIYDEGYQREIESKEREDYNIENSIIGEFDYYRRPQDSRYEYTFNFVNLDPHFVDPDSGDYRLADNSPAINTGTPDTTGLGLPEFDLDGNPRIYEGNLERIDIGCYEYQGNPSVQYLFDGFVEDTYLCADFIYVYADLYIPPDVSVIICPSTEVMHMDPMGRDRGLGYGWDIEGCLFAVGTETARIIFTAENPEIGWSGLYFRNGDNNFYTSRLKYCDVEYVNNWTDMGLGDNRAIEMAGAALNLYDYSNIRISHTLFQDNIGILGGGIGVHGESYPYIQYNEFLNNFALYGGGIFWSPDFLENNSRPIVVDSTFTIENNTFEANWAAYQGGAICLKSENNEQQDEIPKVQIINNQIIENWVYDVYFFRGKLRDNSVPRPPLLNKLDLNENLLAAIQDSRDLLLDTRSGSSWVAGGGIYASGCSPLISDNEILSNHAVWEYIYTNFNRDLKYGEAIGGGICLENGRVGSVNFGELQEPDIPEIYNNIISNNEAIAYEYYDYITREDNRSDYSYACGGGIFNGNTNARIINNLIEGNRAIYLQDEDLLTQSNQFNSVEQSRSEYYVGAGGGIFSSVFPGEIIDRTITAQHISSNFINNNTALIGAGMVICGEEFYQQTNQRPVEIMPRAVVTNNLITGNTAYPDNLEGWYYGWDWAWRFEGGGIFTMNTDLLLVNNTIADNNALFAGGISCAVTELTAIDNIFWGNISEGEDEREVSISSNENRGTTDQIRLIWESVAEFYNNDIEDGIDGAYVSSDSYIAEDENNIDAYPEFALTGEHPYMLVDNSPCANAGDPAITMENLADWFLPEVDLKGSSRIYQESVVREGIIDIGAYETGNNPPYDIILGYPAFVPENEAPGYFVGQLSTLDLDEFDTHTYTLVEGEGDDFNDCFEIIGDELYTTCEFNYEDLLPPIRTDDPETSAVKSTERKGDINLTSVSDGDRVLLPNAWINEFHYDNIGTDVGEFVEVVVDNSLRLDLSLLTLTLYNGASSQRSPYNSETVDNFQAVSTYGSYTYYTWNLPANGIQNGAPDGMSLDYFGDVLQFISYEGYFEAASGPAVGLFSTDIGVFEGSSTPVEYSLQLVDPGRISQYTDYIWAGPMAETPGLINTNQTLDVPPPLIGVNIRVRTTDDGENNMYYEELIVIPIIDMNDEPIIELPDEFTFLEDETLEIDFDDFISDEDVDVRVTNSLTLTVADNDSITVDINGLMVTFGAVEDWFGEETLTFTVNDNAGRALASDDVLVIVEPVDDPPFFNEDLILADSLLFISPENTPFLVDFTPYIGQVYGETDNVILSVDNSSRTSWIDVSIEGFEVTFTPYIDHWFGSEHITFLIEDEEGTVRSGINKTLSGSSSRSSHNSVSMNKSRNGAQSQVIIEVTFEPVNDPPILEIPIALEALEDDPSEVYRFLLSPFVVDQTWGEEDSLSLSAIGSEHIDVMIDSFNVVIQSNTADWYGSEDLTFILSDNVTRLTTEVVVEGIIHPYNDAPVLGFIEDVVMDEDTTHDITVTATDVDNLPEELTFSAYVQDGNLSVSVTGNVVTIIPAPDWYGTGSIVVKVFDGMWYDQQLVLVTVINLNDPPVLTLPDSFSFPEDETLTVNMFPYIYDADDLGIRLDNYTIELIGEPADISVEIDGVIVTFGTNAENWSGTETLTFVVNDNVTDTREGKTRLTAQSSSRDLSPEETVDIIVTEVNDAPYVLNPLADFEMLEDTIDNSIDLNTVFDDPDLIYGDVLSFSSDVGFYTGMSIDISGGVVTLTPDPDWNGIFGITFIATDNWGLTASDYVEVTVTPDNDAPVFDLPEELSFYEDGVLATNFLQYVNDVDEDDLTLIIGETTNISIEQNNFSLVFSTVEPDWNGEEMITFTISDGVTRATASAAVNIVVIPVNDPPVYTGTTLVTVAEDFGTYEIGDLDDMFEDIEGDELSFTLEDYNPAMLTASLDEDNVLTIESVLHACGTTSVNVTAADGEYLIPASITVNITPINNPPELINLPEHIEMGAYSNMILNLEDCWLDVDTPDPTMLILPVPNFITVEQLPGYDYRFRLDALHIAGMEDIITVVLSDGQSQVMEDILVTVAESEAPIITFLIPNLEYLEDFALTEVVDLDQCFEDPEGMPLTFGAYEVGGMGYLDVVVDADNILHLGSELENWFGTTYVDVWASDASSRTVTTQTLQVEVMPVNDAPYIITEIADITLAEDFGSYVVADLTTIFGDVDDAELTYIPTLLNGDAITVGMAGTDLLLYSVDNVWGNASVGVTADDGHGSRAQVSLDFNVTVTAVYDNPVFDPALDGMEFPIAMAGEIIDFSPWIETFGQTNNVPMGIVLQGEEIYYEVDNVDNAIYSMWAYPVGHQWAYPDQSCTLWLDGGSHVTIILQTDLPDVLTGGTIVLESGEEIRIDLKKEYSSAKNFIQLNEHSDISCLVNDELVIGKEVTEVTQEEITILAYDKTTSLRYEITYNVIIEPRGNDQDIPQLITELIANHPNPFNPSTMVNFSLGEAGRAVITIYNIKGEKVRTLTDAIYQPGIYHVEWNGKDESGNMVSSGLYFYKLETGTTSKIKKMMLLQ
ncbi:MAG: hypothetical protein APR54_04765 [Candidatus Cloacimonas sp. SDB]|nr:MAG: hypothetical protein APR54_04765 [Candidatus Cloacimonas sp. SDB]